MSQAAIQQDLVSKAQIADECRAELARTGRWWLDYSLDHEQGGFYGQICDDNKPDPAAEKGIVLNTRILWFFSEAARFSNNADYRQAAERAYHYLRDYFFDTEFGGYFWSLNADGSVANDKKQVYAQAFGVYALVAYYQLTGEQQALDDAMACFELIERHCIDREQEGYFEAYTREWGKMDDVRLSEKDLNFPKTMNTHLHVLEAYTSLYQVCKEERIEKALAYNIDLFDRYMIDRGNYHLRMFMQDDWQDCSSELTYGHDIECAWLLYKALQSLGDQARTDKLVPDIIELAHTCRREALGELGEVLDGMEKATGKVHSQRVWWVQAEALVGFLVAWKLSGEQVLFATAANVWSFIKEYQMDTERGEWRWHCRLDEPDGARDYKAGFWKGPYHNGRAMIEVAKLLAE